MCANIDESIALRAGAKVSSAHSSSFQSNGSIVIRNVLTPDRDGAISTHMAESATVGIAARLLNAPAVSSARPTDIDDGTLYMLLPLDEKEAEEISDKLGSVVGGGGSLGIGDVFATTRGVAAQNSISNWKDYSACSNDDPTSLFIDVLYGSKGETPTTVIQWSKGTVHYNSD